MKTLLTALLAVSLAANAVLLLRSHSAPALATPTERTNIPAAASAESGIPIATLAQGSAEALRDALRTAGADDWTVRATIEGILRRRQREKLAALRIERLRTAWWRAGQTAQSADNAAIRDLLDPPLRAALGVDPLQLLHAESRYSFLPADKRRKLAQIDLDYADMQRGVSRLVSYSATNTEAEHERILADERRKDVLAALTPEERAEFDLRYSFSAWEVSRRAAGMNASEAEYRAIKPLIDEFGEKARALTPPRTGTSFATMAPAGPEFSANYEALQRETAQRLVAAVGYERASSFVWASYQSEYPALQRAATEAGLPDNTATRVMELSAQIGREAAQIHDDAALTAEQKKAALLPLQQSAQARLNALLPPAAQAKLPADSFRWLSALGEGRYMVPTPYLTSSGGNAVYTITAPFRGQRREPPALPVRP